MIVKKKDDVVGNIGEKHGDKWHSLRRLHPLCQDNCRLQVSKPTPVVQPGTSESLPKMPHQSDSAFARRHHLFRSFLADCLAAR